MFHGGQQFPGFHAGRDLDGHYRNACFRRKPLSSQKPRKLDAHEKVRLDADTLNNITQTVALLAAGAWAVYTFIYQEMIAPAQAPPSLSVSSVLEKAGHQGDMTALRCSVTRANVGQSSVRVLGLTYNLVGIKERFLTHDAFDPAFETAAKESRQIYKTRYQGSPERQEIILRSGLLFAGAHPQGDPSELNPAEKVTRDMVFYADRARFDRVRLHVSLAFGRLDDPATPLVLETTPDGMLEAHPAPVCRAAKTPCAEVFTTDFNTELSLWE